MKTIAIRAALFALAFVHAFPAKKHLALFFAEPSWGEAWKGFGALGAIALYLLPPAIHVRAIAALWAQRRTALVLGGWALAIVHAVPASDHVPRFFAAPSFADAWRGFGSAIACAWFVAPLRLQAMLVTSLRSVVAADGAVTTGGLARPGRLVSLLAVGLFFGGVCGVGLVRAAASRAPANARANATRAPSLVVPHVTAALAADGELDDEGWETAARTGAFTASGAPARPFSEARFAERDGMLYVMLYAADEDIRTTDARHDDPLYVADAFQLVFHGANGDRLIDVSPKGVVTDGARRPGSASVDFGWESRAKVGVDADGTPNDPSDQDEEWVVEMAIPLEALGDPRARVLGLEVRRCDEVRDVGRVCAGWSGELVLAHDSAGSGLRR